MFVHERTDTITFNMEAFQSQTNNYKESLPHKADTHVVFVGSLGMTVSIPMLNLPILVAIFEELNKKKKGRGYALDALFNMLNDPEKSSEICKNF
ncbi:hypothetical protein [Rhizobium phage RHEph16]|uniref:Uncharacterized protein n=1 Tax=Rhizobium phage RHEph16 TaxID=2836132 RepID=A0AAE8AVC0_9CAUD|nr:hypothetical protein PP750_gp06 [Rhizobium phage RHEph16]QXV74315.1 hypothetical protein [Rhizobium phage RHEph16]